MDTALRNVLVRAGKWPSEAQRELAAVALEMEAVVEMRPFAPSREELEAIDDADGSGIATDDEVRAAFKAFRRE
jgi:hypothetical protein